MQAPKGVSLTYQILSPYIYIQYKLMPESKKKKIENTKI